jgi:hypothetical protein
MPHRLGMLVAPQTSRQHLLPSSATLVTACFPIDFQRAPHGGEREHSLIVIQRRPGLRFRKLWRLPARRAPNLLWKRADWIHQHRDYQVPQGFARLRSLRPL